MVDYLILSKEELSVSFSWDALFPLGHGERTPESDFAFILYTKLCCSPELSQYTYGKGLKQDRNKC